MHIKVFPQMTEYFGNSLPSKMLRDSLALRSGVPQHHSQELDHYIWGLERGKALSLEKRSVQDAKSDL